jgi:MFS superfamily sulfate permease-like transporter
MKITDSHLPYDLLASIVIFFIAIPLCLGIALASGAPLISGIVSGIIGGCVVSFISGSRLSVSGPAAGLAIIVFNSISLLEGMEIFLLSVIIAGIFQIIMSFLRLGNLNAYFPSSVIKGMLSGIGIILIFQQIPHLIGYHKSPLADETSFLSNPLLTIDNIYSSLKNISVPAIIISLISLFALILWNRPKIKNNPLFSLLPAPLIAVTLGILYTYLTNNYFPQWALMGQEVVNMPTLSSFDQLIFTTPHFLL